MNDLINEWNLTSSDCFGMFNYKYLFPVGEWDQEIENRKQIFSKLPPFVEKIDEKIKIKMRDGIPPSHRRRYWFLASGGYSLLQETGNIYESAVKIAKKRQKSVDSSFGCCIDVLNFLPLEASSTIDELLHTLWVNNPKITFSPLIPPVCALLLLYLEPTLVYFSIQAMINRSYLDEWYFPINRESFLASAEVVGDLSMKICPEVYKHSQVLGLSLSHVCISIFPSFFLPFLSLPVTTVIFDSFIFEGRKVLIRLCLGLLNQEKEKLLLTNNSTDFYKTILHAISSITSPSSVKNLIKNSFKIYLSRERHIIPLELKIIKNKIGLLSEKHSFEAINHVNIFSNGQKQRRNSLPNILDTFFEFHYQSGARIAESLFSSLVRRNSEAKPSEFIMKNFCDLNEYKKKNILKYNGNLLNNYQFNLIKHYLPGSIKHYTPYCIFQLSSDGTTFSSLLNKGKPGTPHILLIQTEHSIIGAILVDCLKLNSIPSIYGRSTVFYFKNDESFFFPSEAEANTMYQYVTSNTLSIGGPKPAIFIEDGFKYIISDFCETFNSPKLTEKLEGDKILDLELYKLELNHKTLI